MRNLVGAFNQENVLEGALNIRDCEIFASLRLKL